MNKLLSIVIFLLATTFVACEKEELMPAPDQLAPQLEANLINVPDVQIIALESNTSDLIPLVEELIEEISQWDKNYGIQPQLENALRKLEGGDPESALLKLQELVIHLEELLVDPDGPIFGQPEKEALIEDLIEAIDHIIQIGTICSKINETTVVQIIYVGGVSGRAVLIRTWSSEPETEIMSFRIDCEHPLEDLAGCVFNLLREEDKTNIVNYLGTCGETSFY